MGLITSSNALLNELDYTNLTSSEQNTVDALIEVASELIQKECNRIFLTDTYVDELYNGDNLNSIVVKNIPLTSLDEVKVSPSYQEDDLEFEAGNFKINENTGEIRWLNLNQIDSAVDTTNYIGYFPAGFQNIKISYHGGFSSVPYPIQQLCADLVKAMYSPGDVVGNIESEKLGQYFYKTKKGVMDNILVSNKRIISLYKIRKV